MACSRIENVNRYFAWLERVLKSGAIDEPKELHSFAEIDEDNGHIIGWLIPHKRVHFIQGSSLTCTEEGAATASAEYCIPEYHFHFQPGSKNVDLEVFRVDLDRGEEAHFNSSEQRRAAGDHLRNGETPFNFSNFNCRLALLMSMIYMDKNVYPLDDKDQVYFEPILSNKKDG